MPTRRAAAASLGWVAWAALASGCGMFHHPPPLPAVYIPQPPLIFPAPAPAPVAAPEVLAPEAAPAPTWTLALDIGPPPPPPQRRAPPAPKPAPVVATAAPDQAPPQLNSGLSPAQQLAYRGNTRAILDRAQNDLKILAQRQLSGSAAATRAQAAEYVRQAQDALAHGDLVRAETLANKAETLARFLLGE